MPELHTKQTWTDKDYRERGQFENWNLLLDVSNATRYGFAKDFHPDPRKPLDTKEVQERMEKLEEEWTREWKGRGLCYPTKSQPYFSIQAPCPKFTKLPLEAQCFLHDALTRTSKTESNWSDVLF